MKKVFTSEYFSSRRVDLLTLFFYLSILIFIIGLSFTDVPPPPSGWYQQFMPNLNGKPISDVFFIDTLTGWAVTYTGMAFDSAYILKTTNGGDNWNVIYYNENNFTKVRFINQNTGFTTGVTAYIGASSINKTTNGGVSWFSLTPPDPFFTLKDINISNIDTLWVVCDDGASGGVFRTTNGGVNWTQQLNIGVDNPLYIYMYNAHIGFLSATSTNSVLYHTTNSGVNWIQVSGIDGFTDMKFIDSMTGWKANNTNSSIKKTTNGGLNWVQQVLPSGGNITISSMSRIAYVSPAGDTLWGVNGSINVGSGTRGILWHTTNGGINWTYQLPDTSIHMGFYFYGQFIDAKHGWAWGYALYVFRIFWTLWHKI